MTLTIKNIALALAATFMLAATAQAQTSNSSSWSKSWSSSSGSSWGTRSDGTRYQNGFNNSDSRSSSTATVRNGNFSNTTRTNQNQSSRNGFSQSSGPGGMHQSSFNNNSGRRSTVNTRRWGGPHGNVTNTRSINSQHSNQNSMSRGFGPGGTYDNRHQSNTGSTTVGNRTSVNSIFGPRVQAGTTRTIGHSNQSGSSRGVNSGGVYNNQFNKQNNTSGGSNFFRTFPW